MNKFQDSYTDSAREALRLAAEAAANSSDGAIGTEHLLLGILRESKGAAGVVLREAGASAEKYLSLMDELISHSSGEGKRRAARQMPYTPRAEGILLNAADEAAALEMQQVGTEHILLALLEDIDGVAARLLHTMEIDLGEVYRKLLDIADAPPERSRDLMQSVRGAGEAPGASGAGSYLDKYASDLTEQAREGHLDPIVGRDAQMQRLMQILSRRTKNNPCLIGEPGVGNTAIVEGLAERIVRGEVPPVLANKRLLSLDMAGMVAGTKFRGEFEERMKLVLQEVMSSGDVLLFIDEIHTMVGAGGAEGSLDASNIMKPFLSRGQIQLIGATTVAEYRKYIEKDAALERRFQPVMVEEPSREETVEILRGLRPSFEKHHGVEVSDEALETAVSLAERYINDRFLPDKAIDLLDESCARTQLSALRTLEGSQEETLKIRALEGELEEAIAGDDLERAKELRAELSRMKEKKDKESKRRLRRQESHRPGVKTEDIAQTIALWTGIPADKVAEAEGKRLLALDKLLHKRVIGQEEAVSAVAKAIRRGRAGLKDPKRPIGSFLFLGPTGVGKTELSKALSEAVFGSEQAMIRVDMSEYMEKHSVSKLVGSPPGYVGYEEGGQLSEKVRRHPYSVILFDEIEKAHPDVFNILLQVLDEGHITDSQGRKVDFKNTILIMTSNAGAAATQNPKRLGFGQVDQAKADYDKMKSGVMEAIRQIFKPEFLNRIDDILVFHSLGKEEIRKITALLFKDLEGRCREQMNITLKIRQSAMDEIAKAGFDEKYGARPLKRAIQTKVEDPLSEQILGGSVKAGDTVKVSFGKDGTFRFKVD